MKEKKKFDRNIVVPKKFPVKEGTYKAPPQGLNIGNPLYMSSNKDYGYLQPTSFEIPNRFYPRNNTFTNQFPDNYKFDGFNTAVTFSKVHQALNEY